MVDVEANVEMSHEKPEEPIHENPVPAQSQADIQARLQNLQKSKQSVHEASIKALTATKSQQIINKKQKIEKGSKLQFPFLTHPESKGF